MTTSRLSQLDCCSQAFTDKLIHINDLTAHSLDEMKTAQDLLREIIKLSADHEGWTTREDTQQQN